MQPLIRNKSSAEFLYTPVNLGFRFDQKEEVVEPYEV